MSFDFTNWRARSKAIADQAAETFRDQAAGVTDQAVRASVDQALRVLSIAVEQIKQKDPPPPPVSLGVGMNLGLFYLEMQVHVPREGEPGDLAAELKRASRDDGGEADPDAGGQTDDVP